MCSVVVVLPASMCAITPMLRIVLRPGAAFGGAAIGVSSEKTNHRDTEDTEKTDRGNAGRTGGATDRLSLSILSVCLLGVLCVSVVNSVLRCYHAKCENALLASAILMVFSRLVMASPSRR